MKSKLSALLLIGMLLFAGTSFAQPFKGQLLLGSWKLESLKAAYPAKVSPQQKKKLEKIISEDEKEFKQAGFLFSGNHQLLIGKKEFTWEMDADGNHVNVKKEGKMVTVATIVQLSAHQLVFTRPDEGMIVTYTLFR